MNRRKSLAVLTLCLQIIILWGWFDRKQTEFIAEAFNQSFVVNSLVVKDSKTEKKILTLTDSDPDFSQMAHIYDAGYAELNWSERKLLKNDPVYEVEFLLNDDVLFTMGIYKVEKDQISLIPNDNELRIFSYSPDGKDTYIFGRK
ncbi:hypothetical protein [Fervidibacillus albus]|uniref:Uncharacterized protein n=1 Tax=Fervidibacillus albus TaxID=2980026 RepID=A0A9E8RV01_9BACI|nr:hypothetical protein [Fervidibacillus albus]WAA08911.1 hypothetical protein OE104_09860 [Fervidibacillus albus]